MRGVPDLQAKHRARLHFHDEDKMWKRCWDQEQGIHLPWTAPSSCRGWGIPGTAPVPWEAVLVPPAAWHTLASVPAGRTAGWGNVLSCTGKNV